MAVSESPDRRAATSMTRTSDTELVITRSFDAPARIVFDAFTKPELVRRWWAPESRRVSLVSCDADVRPGGRWRYVMQHAVHGEIAFSGEYREVSPPDRLVYTETLEPADDSGGAIVTVTFDEREGRTLLTSHSRFPTKDILDMVLATGMEGGMRETMEQLDALVTSLK